MSSSINQSTANGSFTHDDGSVPHPTNHLVTALLTDVYQVTMTYAHWKNNRHNHPATFELFFRKNPFGGEYTIFAGLDECIKYITHFSFSAHDITYLKSIPSLQHCDDAFFDWLGQLNTKQNAGGPVRIYAMKDGTVAFPRVPLIVVEAPLALGQLLETTLLTLVNYPSLLATNAARMVRAAQSKQRWLDEAISDDGNDKVTISGQEESTRQRRRKRSSSTGSIKKQKIEILPAQCFKTPICIEFGLRRAQGIDGALSASRAAYVGGCAATSNVLAGKVLGVPVSGTMAHSWVMLHPSEKEAFDAYKSLFPEKCTFLVDTYDTLKGTEIACQIESFNAIRLDSGDLFALAPKCRSILDQHGHTKAKIIASGDLTEEKIKELKDQNIPISTWGVGTALVTGAPSGSLSGVYKLAAIREKNTWRSVMKISNTPAKQSFPGPLALKRFYKNESVLCDVVYQENTPLQSPKCFHTGNSIHLKKYTEATELLLPILKDGHTCYTFPTLSEVRSHALEELTRFSTSTPQLAICSALLSEQQSLKDKLRNTNESSYSC